MGAPPKFPIKLVKCEINNKFYFSYFDSKGHIFYPPTDYLIYMVDINRSENNTVLNRAYTLKIFFQYLSDHNINYLDVDDIVIEEFRDNELITFKSNSQNNKNTRKKSINVILRRIYDFYAWLQTKNSQLRILGISGHQIYSTLLENNSKLNYPKCFPRVGENSKHNVKFVPTHDHYSELFDYFIQKKNTVAIRNTLMLRILRQTGLRVGSLASLTINQFDEKTINQSLEYIIVCPEVQKYNYTKKFEIPITLANQILSYINKERINIIDKYNSYSNNLFLSSTKGTPLSSHAISTIFITASKTIGWNDRGVGPHAWRRFFACETLENDIESSIELGLDTSLEAIGLRTAEKLGHNSISSQESYIRYFQQNRKGSAISRANDLVKVEREENNRLKMEVAELRQIIEKNNLRPK